MKKSVALCMLLMSVLSAGAQQLSVGFRSGLSAWSQRATGGDFKLEAVPGNRFSWDQSLFMRREGKNRWAFEGSIAHSSLNNTKTVFVINDFSPYGSYDLTTRQRADNFELSLSAQYDITCAHLQACPLMRRFHSYAGVSVTPVFTRIRQEYETTSPLIDLAGPRVDQHFDVWAGLSHTMLFDASKHVVLSSVLEGSVAPTQLFAGRVFSNDYHAATRVGFRLGAAYRF